MTKTREGRGRLVGVTLVVVVVVAAVLAWQLWPASEHHDVVIIGDSVTHQSEAQIRDALSGAAHLTVEGYPGFTTGELVPVLDEAIAAERAAGRPLDRVGLLVGYNDVLRSVDRPSDITDMVERAAQFRCAVFIAVPVAPPWGAWMKGRDRTAFTRFDERLRAAAGKHPNVHVDDRWARAVEPSKPGELIEPDGIHPLPAGSERLAADYRGALADDC